MVETTTVGVSTHVDIKTLQTDVDTVLETKLESTIMEWLENKEYEYIRVGGLLSRFYTDIAGEDPKNFEWKELLNKIGFKNAKAQQFIAAYDFSVSYPLVNDFLDLGWCKISQISRVFELLTNDEMLELLQTARDYSLTTLQDYIRSIIAGFKETSSLDESKVLLKMDVYPEQKETITEAIQLAIEKGIASSNNEALASICDMFRNNIQDI